MYKLISIRKKNDYVSNLYFMNIDDNDPKQWTYGNHRTNSPKWSPDGSELAFVSNREGSPQIYILSKLVARQNK